MRTAKSVAWGAPLAFGRPGHVAMFHVGRSGSRVLASLLDQHPHVFWDGEIYEPSHRLFRPGRDPLRLLDRRRRRAGRRWYGFEMKFFHTRLVGVPLPQFYEALCDRGFERFIVLRRRNTLRKVVSSIRLHAEKRSHRRPGQATLERIVVDVDDVRIDRDRKPLIDYLEDYERQFAALDVLLEGRSTLRLTYEEDIADDPTRAYRRCCEFLGLEPHPVRVDYGRTNPFPLRDIVVNLGEVEEALRGSPFEWMVRD
jgi:hypothetical protein